MKKYLLFVVMSLIAFLCQASPRFSVYRLTCEQQVNPVAIGTNNPRFSWRIQAEQRGFEQSAYQIIVADSPDLLAKNEGNMWNSGKIKASSSLLVEYAGKLLQPEKMYYWKVKIWNQSGKPSDWSLSNSFSIGLLEKKDWGKAQWVALEKDRPDELIEKGITGGTIVKRFGNKKTGMYQLCLLYTSPSPRD